MKLIFKTKEQKLDFTRTLIKMAHFIYFSLGGIPIWPSRPQVDKGMSENLTPKCTTYN